MNTVESRKIGGETKYEKYTKDESYITWMFLWRRVRSTNDWVDNRKLLGEF